MKTEILINNLINEVAQKVESLNEVSIALYGLGQKKIRYRFMSEGLLDYYLTKISPMKLAEYKRAKELTKKL